MSAVQMRRTVHQRLDRLEERADGHDAMREQLAEIYTAFKNAKMIAGFFNRMWAKAFGGLFALLGGVAVVLTIWEKASALLGHH